MEIVLCSDEFREEDSSDSLMSIPQDTRSLLLVLLFEVLVESIDEMEEPPAVVVDTWAEAGAVVAGLVLGRRAREPRSYSSGPSKQYILVEAPNCNISPGNSRTPRAPLWVELDSCFEHAFAGSCFLLT